MTLRHTGGCFLFHLELLQLCCHCLWLTPSFKLAFKPFGPSYLLMPQHDWLLPQSLKPWEEILKIILMFRVGIKAYILSFYLQEGWVLSNHGCSLWAFISNIWSPKHFLQHEGWPTKSLCYSERASSPWPVLFIFLRCSAGIEKIFFCAWFCSYLSHVFLSLSRSTCLTSLMEQTLNGWSLEKRDPPWTRLFLLAVLPAISLFFVDWSSL